MKTLENMLLLIGVLLIIFGLALAISSFSLYAIDIVTRVPFGAFGCLLGFCLVKALRKEKKNDLQLLFL